MFTNHGQIEAAAEHGRVCALSAACLRDLQECAETYPELFSAKPFGPTVFSGVALANAFGSPDAAPGQIRTAARMALWCFAADWLVDYVATTPDQVEELVRGCAAVGGGAEPDPEVPLQRFLAVLRSGLEPAPSWSRLRPIWQEYLRRYLMANAREWEWKSAAARPDFEAYLGNADNFGSSLVNVSHWIANGSVETAGQLSALAEVSDEVQRVLRLLNDLATYDRDVTWGDLNALMLGVTKAEVMERIKELAEKCGKLIEPLYAGHPAEAVYLERQIGFSSGFYGLTDYWGAL